MIKDQRTGFVYEIQSPGGSYVGSTILRNFMVRWKSHITLLKQGKHYCKPLQKCWDEHDITSFCFRVLEANIELDNLGDREIYWIRKRESFADDKARRKIIRQDKIRDVMSDLTAGLTYRNIVKKREVSMGWITAVKERYLDA